MQIDGYFTIQLKKEIFLNEMQRYKRILLFLTWTSKPWSRLSSLETRTIPSNPSGFTLFPFSKFPPFSVSNPAALITSEHLHTGTTRDSGIKRDNPNLCCFNRWYKQRMTYQESPLQSRISLNEMYEIWLSRRESQFGRNFAWNKCFLSLVVLKPTWNTTTVENAN